MPSFRYQSVTNAGQPNSGVIDAPDRASAVRLLGIRGEFPTDLDLADAPRNGHVAVARRPAAADSARVAEAPAAAFSLPWRSGHPTLNRSDLANFIRELATALEAGLPLMQALRTVRKQASGAAMPVILDHLIERVEAGAPLHQAAKEYGRPFDELVVGMLRAADASGEMNIVLHQLADLLDRSVELRREVLGAAFYPMIVAGLVIISAIILVTVLVPRLIGPIAAEGGFNMPWPTQVVLGTAGFLSKAWYWCLIALAVIALGWRAWIRIPANRLAVDRLLLRMPLLGRLLRDVAVARFTRTLGTLVSAGLPILDALRITCGTLGNTALMQAVDQVQTRVTSGAALADPLERSGLFPPLLVQIVNLGERSGRLEKMLLHAAGAFDRQVNNSVKIFSKALPPVLLIIMALVAGFILAAILLPLLELQSMIK